MRVTSAISREINCTRGVELEVKQQQRSEICRKTDWMEGVKES